MARQTFAVVAAVLALVLTPIIAQKLRGSSTNAAPPAPVEKCKGMACRGVPEDRFAILLDKEVVPVYIGNSESDNEKCVPHPTQVICEADAAELGKRLNDDDHPDNFVVTVKDGSQVCARRTDKKEGWGMFLKIGCTEVKASPSEKCMCLTTPEGDCSCKGCTDAEQTHTCSELLGPCVCRRSEEAICDCDGYCHTSSDRKTACEKEAGCQWAGQWCEAQVGLLWS
mmetsp:Transcript_107694/g.168194  ORF Transcript_107694/g.168194 Transcript_107694/m.168194 type:complete len:226 (+) Transcript_107694:78-755(+)